jgi:ABC-type sugar transport system ATPase subunit
MMVGRDIAPGDVCREPVPETSPIALEVRQWNDRAKSEGGPGLLRDINFFVRLGEIIVFAGLSGAGRTELALSLFGARRNVTGELYLFGRRVEFRSPDQAIAAGVGYLPEDRKEAGLFLDMSVAANIASAGLKQLGTWWMRDRQRDQIAREYVTRLKIAARSVRQSALGLSGGNQQKTLFAKWLLVGPKVLIVDEPTRGIDVGAKAEVHGLLYKLAREGTAVIVISSELPEVLAVADRIIVLHEGAIAGELSRDQATEENVIHLASVGKES